MYPSPTCHPCFHSLLTLNGGHTYCACVRHWPSPGVVLRDHCFQMVYFIVVASRGFAVDYLSTFYCPCWAAFGTPAEFCSCVLHQLIIEWYWLDVFSPLAPTERIWRLCSQNAKASIMLAGVTQRARVSFCSKLCSVGSLMLLIMPI